MKPSFLLLSLALAAALAAASPAAGLAPQWRGSVRLTPCPIPGTDDEMLCGTYEVFENRRTMAGRMISLNLAVLPSRAPNPRPDPIFWLHGGPGAAATTMAASFRSSWMRSDRDLVLVDQRGTGRSRPLNCKLPGSAENLQGYLEGLFDRESLYRRCKRRLQKVANLRMYTTPDFADDLDQLRQAMGYEKINVIGASYGTRSALIYLRRHGRNVRTVVLEAVDPPALLNPLYHADSAQRAIERIFAECAQDAGCAAAFPEVAPELDAVLRRLEQGPVPVTVSHPDTGEPVPVELTRHAFAEAIRTLMYSAAGSRWVPYLIHLTYEGIYWPITEVAIAGNRGLDEDLSLGMLLSVVCAGDVARTDPADVARLTENTFFGDHRVRTEMAICEFWPTAVLPASYGDPVESDVPVLLLSGTQDPVTPPEAAAEAARHLTNSLHLVAPGAHNMATGACIDAIRQRFVNRGSVAGLNTRCAEGIRLPPFELPP